MAEISDLSVNDASNTARFPDSMAIPAVNNGARALEGMIARTYRDRSGYTMSSGSGTAYTILTNATYPAHAAGMWFIWKAHVACGDAPTLTINALDPKTLLRPGSLNIVTGDILTNQMVVSIYNSSLDAFECIGIGFGAPEGEWQIANGSRSRLTYNPSSVTLPQLAERFAALQDDLLAKGIIGEA